MPLIPDQLYEDIRQSRVVLLCGAGTTTEWGPYGTPSFYDIIRARSGLKKKQPPFAFPDVMQYFCDTVDGGDKRRLIQEGIDRIEMFAQPTEMNPGTPVQNRFLKEASVWGVVRVRPRN